MARLTIDVPMRWSDIDGYGHVNNAAMLTLLEEARVAAFWDTGAEPGDDARRAAQVLSNGTDTTSHTLVARQEIEYLAPLNYSQQPVSVQVWIGHIGGASLDIYYEVYAPQGTLCARAASSIVMVDAASGRPRRLTDHERSALQVLVEEPITFRRRS